MSRPRILCVGAGNDGTQSVHHMVQALFRRAGGGRAAHGYCWRELQQAFCEFRETGDPAYLAALRRMVADCPYEGVVGADYAALLPLFAETHGRGVKLVHLRRADRAACIADLANDCRLSPMSHGYYAPGGEATIKRMAAFHFDDMSRTEWDRLSLEEKCAWHYDKTHALIGHWQGLFYDHIEIETEKLDDEATRRELARIVTGNDAEPAPQVPHNAVAVLADVGSAASEDMNDLQRHARAFEDITPWDGIVPAGYVVDFLGTVTPKEFLEPWGVNPAFVDGQSLALPRPALGESKTGEDFWFESLNWLLAAHEARGRFVMMTLGALHGYQAVGSCRALQILNPMPYKLVAVEPIPENVQRIRRMMRDNGIDPDDQWLIQAAVSGNNEPAFFPVGGAGLGSQNCISSDNELAREYYIKQIIMEDRTEETLQNLLLHNSTGLRKKIADDRDDTAEIKLVSCVTLQDLMQPFERVDYIEADMQESEIRAFPPFLDLLRRKAKRIHMATHGGEVHAELHRLFAAKGWRIVFSYAPESVHPSPWGDFRTNDGVLTVVNPDF